MAQEVKIYSVPTCPWCKKTKQFLDDNGVPYQDFNVAIVIAAGEGAKAALQAHRYLQRLSE